MDLGNLGKQLVGMGAPMLGSLLGGKVGEKVGEIVAGVLGCEPDPASIDKALQNNPQALVDLKKYEMDNKVALQGLQLQETQAHLDDKQNARAREARIVEATGQKDYFLYGLAALVVLGFFVLCAVLMFVTLPTGSNQVVFMLFGALATGFGTVLQYFFGSSKSSAAKTELMTLQGKK